MNEMPNIEAGATAEAFAGNVATIIDHGAIAVMMSIGHRLGLFETLAGRAPRTSEEIAADAELAERYVREWLAVMVTGGIVHYDAAAARYSLSADHAACLVKGAPLGNLAVFAQHVALLGQMQDSALTLFETGEGTRYGDYPCFHQIMAEDSEQSVVAALADHILPLVPGLDARLREGIDVLDAGCGRGLALIELARRFPASRFVGMDLCADAIDYARLAARNAELANVAFEVRDLTGYREPGRFDMIASFDAVHDQKDPEALVQGLRASLKPGGIYLMQDIGGSARLENNLDFPMASLLYAVSCLHCTPISLGQGGRGLGTMWGWETAEAMLHAAGFASVDRHVLPHDPLNVWFVARA
jgi:SAM-dependent methyltransferase